MLLNTCSCLFSLLSLGFSLIIFPHLSLFKQIRSSMGFFAFIFSLLFHAAVGAALLPPLLGLLGFSSGGPTHGSFAAHRVGGAGGGAKPFWQFLQRTSMRSLASLKLGAVIGLVVGFLRAFFHLIF